MRRRAGASERGNSIVNKCLYSVLLLALVLVACASPQTPTPTPAPAAGVVLQKILNDCWGVTQIKELDGNRADHKNAFACARARLLQMALDYPDAAEPHRVLAWGYFYVLQDEAAAQAEYELAAEIYARQGRTADQADVLVRIAQLAIQYDRRSGCDFLRRAAELDAQNTRITTLLQNFECIPRTSVPLQTPTLPDVTITPAP